MQVSLQTYMRILVLVFPFLSLSCGDVSVTDSDKRIVTLPGPIYPQEERFADDRLLPLGQQFLEALQSDDVRKFSDCWCSVEERLQSLSEDEGIDWTPEVSAHYRKHYESDAELIELYHAMYRTALTKHAGRIEAVTLDHVKTTTIRQPVQIFVRLPNQTLLRFEVDGAEDAHGRWRFLGAPSSLLEITDTADGITEMTFAEPTSVEMENNLERVLGEIEKSFEE